MQEERFIDLYVFIPGKQSHHDLRLLVDVAPSSEFSVAIKNFNDRTRRRFTLHFSHFVGENPGMPL
jgi:hypothetical protein